ncbi:MAG TPA: hypothetical protein VGM90_27300 [Kofleriaceae bacterium]|jgi:hypothetical protein
MLQKFAVVLALCAVGSSMTGCAKALIATGTGITIVGGLAMLKADDSVPMEEDPHTIDLSLHNDDTKIGAGMVGIGIAMILGGLILFDGPETDDAKQQLKLTMDRSNPFATQSALSMRGGL